MDTMQMTYAELVKALGDGERAKLQAALDKYKAKQEQPKKKTGYERVEKNGVYYYPISSQNAGSTLETKHFLDDDRYRIAAYYSDKTVAENNIRADILLRQLRRFAVEHREYELDWLDDNADKYYIAFNYKDDGLFAWHAGDNRQFGIIYFDSFKTAQLAIDTFKDELTWYFKEYKDSL